MMHPFVPNLSDRSLDELTETINKLTKNLAYATRSLNYSMAGQLQMVLESYRTERDRQQRELLDGDSSITGSIDIT